MLDGFLTRFDDWVDRDDPTQDVQLAVMSWIHRLQARPHRGADRRLDLGILWWFAEIPETDVDGHVTMCLFQIDEVAQLVTCDQIASLRRPIT